MLAEIQKLYRNRLAPRYAEINAPPDTTDEEYERLETATDEAYRALTSALEHLATWVHSWPLL